MFDSWIDKKRYCYFPEPFRHSKNKIKIELDLSDYAKKIRFKRGNKHGYIKFSKEADLANLKSDVDELELKAVPSVLNNFKKYSR